MIQRIWNSLFVPTERSPLIAPKGTASKSAICAEKESKKPKKSKKFTSRDQHSDKLFAFGELLTQLHFDAAKHRLAAKHVAAKQLCIHTIPRAMVLLAIYSLLKLANYCSDPQEARVFYAFASVAFQELWYLFLVALVARLSLPMGFNKETIMYHNTAHDLEGLISDLESEMEATVSAVYAEMRLCRLIFPKTVSQYRAQHEQCLKGCKFSIPSDIQGEFKTLLLELDAGAESIGEDKLYEEYGERYHDRLYIDAGKDLEREFTEQWGWPLRISHRAFDAVKRNPKHKLLQMRHWWDASDGSDNKIDATHGIV